MATRNNDKDGVKIAGTAKADTINNGGSNVTIDGGKGNDYINRAGATQWLMFSTTAATIQSKALGCRTRSYSASLKLRIRLSTTKTAT